MYRVFIELDEQNKIKSLTYNLDPLAEMKTAAGGGALPTVYTHEFLLSEGEKDQLRDEMHLFTFTDGLLQHDNNSGIAFTPIQIMEKERIGVSIIGTNGYVLEYGSIFINEEPGPNMITAPINEPFLRPRWNGTSWEEGATEAEITAYEENRPHAKEKKLQEQEQQIEMLTRSVLDLYELNMGGL